MARSYRDALARLEPEVAGRLDAWCVEHGQAWIVGQSWTYDDEELLTLAEVAELASVEVRTVYAWHQRGLPYTSTVDGPRVRVGDLMRWEQERRQRRAGNPTA